MEDPSGKTKQLVKAILGITILYAASSFLYYKLITTSYSNIETGGQQKLQYPIVILMATSGLGWFVGFVGNIYKLQQRRIPQKNIFICSILLFISAISLNKGIEMARFGTVVIVKSYSGVIVIIIGIFCSKVISPHLKLGIDKLWVVLGIIFGLTIMNIFRVDANDGQQDYILGFVFLIVSIIADGFVADTEASIKQTYRPQFMEMLYHINRWTFILAMSYSIFAKFSLGYILGYLFSHPIFSLQLLLFSSIVVAGQMFIYKTILGFKQHMVSLIITIKKMLVMFVMMIVFNRVTMLQFIGFIIVLAVCGREIWIELKSEIQLDRVSRNENKDMHDVKPVQLVQDVIENSKNGQYQTSVHINNAR